MGYLSGMEWNWARVGAFSRFGCSLFNWVCSICDCDDSCRLGRGTELSVLQGNDTLLSFLGINVFVRKQRSGESIN